MALWVLRRLGQSALVMILLMSVATLAGPARAQATAPRTAEQAYAVASRHMLRETAIIPAWESATVRRVPQPHYGLDGRVSAYVFSVVKDGADAGHITVSSAPMANPVLEFSTAPARHKAALDTVRSAAQSLNAVIDERRPLYLGMLAYYYRIDDGGATRLIEMSTGEVAPLNSTQIAQVEANAGRLTSPDLVPAGTPHAGAPEDGAPQATLFKLLQGPDYMWYRGCAATAVANAMGHWADRGYADLVYGGSAGDFPGTMDALATLMGTSIEGWTWLPISDDVTAFAAQRGYVFQSTEQYLPPFSAYVAEIDAHRPIVVLVNGHPYYGDHFITGFGYEYDTEDPSYRYMVVHDTWGSPTEDHWVQYGVGYTSIWIDTVVPPLVQVDATAPASAVASLPAYQPETTFAVTWSGTDEGWGIAEYDVQVRDEGDALWADWITGTTGTGASFTGSRGRTYCFRSRAMDIDHNTEAYGDADACTTVLPALSINHLDGRPGSTFVVTGSAFPASTDVAVGANGHALGAVTTDPAGNLSFLLGTGEADEGVYRITVQPGSGAWVRFRLASGYTLWPVEGSGPTLMVPAGVALGESVYLPLLLR